MPDRNRSEKISYFGVITASVLGLYLSSLHSYLLFHSLIEITTIAIGFTLFILTWNTHRYLANNALRLLGIGYGFIALIDLLHALAYKGMNIFPGVGANLPTQLWIAARSLQAVTLCAAPLFTERRVDNRAIFGGYSVAVSVLVALVYSGNFPDCYIEGKGLTFFKIGSEYAITAMLLASLYLFSRDRKHFNDKVFLLTISSIACTALSELSFTAYVSVYGSANMLGHYFKLAAFYLIYQAILVTGLKEPFDLIFRELQQAQEAIGKARDTLEDQVRERTAELRTSEEKYRALIESANDAVFIHEIMEDGMPGPFIEVNELACVRLGHSKEELARLSPMELDDPHYRDRIAESMKRILIDGQAVFETAHMTKDGRSIPVEVSTHLTEIRGRHLLFSIARDITERKRAEDALHRLNRELRAIRNCDQVLVRAEDEQALLNDICRIVCDDAGYHMAWVGYAENDAAKTIRPVAWAGAEYGHLEQERLSWANTEQGRSPSGTAIRNGTSACIQDFTTDPEAAPWREFAAHHGYRASIALPLKDESANTFGILNIYSTEPNAFTPDEIRLLEELSDDLAFGIIALRVRIERQRTEEALRVSERKLAEASRIAHVGYWERDFLTESITLSDEACRIGGLSQHNRFLKLAEWHAQWLNLILPEDRSRVTQALADALAGGPRYNVEYRLVRPDGEVRSIHTYADITRDASGKPLRMFGTMIDITERKQVEEEIRKLNEDLEQRVKERTAELEKTNLELERMNQLFVGRELRMIELKERIAALEGKTPLESTKS